MKNRLTLNMLIDLALLISTAALSFTGFIVKVVIPSHHAIRHEGAEPWLQTLGGMGRHDWGDIHLWVGIIWTLLLTAHLLLHLKMITSYINKHCTNVLGRQIILFLIFVLLFITLIPWLYFLF